MISYRRRFGPLRLLVLVLALAIVGLSLWALVEYVPEWKDVNTEQENSGYVGTILGAVGLLLSSGFLFVWFVGPRKSAEVVDALRELVLGDLRERMRRMRLQGYDIEVTVNLDGRSESWIESSQMVARRHIIVGATGAGKSYLALKTAVGILAQGDRVPVFVPLGVADLSGTPTQWVSRFVEQEYNLPRDLVETLVESGRVVPVFDGLEEIPEFAEVDDYQSEIARLLRDWHVLSGKASFVLTARNDAWPNVRALFQEDNRTRILVLGGVSRIAAHNFLSYVLGSEPAASMILDSVGQMKLQFATRTPWGLTMIAGSCKEYFVPGRDAVPDELRREISQLSTIESLTAKFVETTAIDRRSLLRRWRSSGDLTMASNYAKYLAANSATTKEIDGVLLDSRYMVLHRLWPVAGRRAPRVVDFAMCVVLSVPGLWWLWIFMSPHGTTARAITAVAIAVWLILLVRTSTKAWVSPAIPDWSRLADPRFTLRQLGAALVVGLLVWWFFDLLAGLLAFLTAWLIVGLTVGFGQTLTTDRESRSVGPTGVLKRERLVSRISAWCAFPLLSAGFVHTFGLKVGFGSAVLYCAVVGETVACALWRRYIAMIIASPLRFPIRPAKCLMRLSDAGLVKQVGTAFEFRHDEILTYLANRR